MKFERIKSFWMYGYAINHNGMDFEIVRSYTNDWDAWCILNKGTLSQKYIDVNTSLTACTFNHILKLISQFKLVTTCDHL